MASRFLSFFVYSNIWIGLGSAFFAWEFYDLNGLKVDFNVISFVFFATVLTYTFQRSVKLFQNHQTDNPRLKWMDKQDLAVKIILIISLVVCVRSVIYFSLESIYVLIGCGFFSLFYIVKIPGVLGKNLRDIPSLKIFLIAIVWSITSTLVPYYNLDGQDINFPWLLLIANFAFIMAITIPFDIRDLHLDEPEKKTIPQLLGEKKATYFSIALLIGYWPILCLIADQALYFSLVGVCLSIVLVKESIKTKSDFYFSFFVDGLLVLLPVLLWLDLYLS